MQSTQLLTAFEAFFNSLTVQGMVIFIHGSPQQFFWVVAKKFSNSENYSHPSESQLHEYIKNTETTFPSKSCIIQDSS
jgi:hypothetical protein